MATISFIVESGNGDSDATSYVTVAEYIQYWANFGVTISTSTGIIQARLNVATEYIDNIYQRLFGTKYNTTQALNFPRYLESSKFEEIYDPVPSPVKDATMYLAYKIDSLTEGLYSVDNPNIKTEKYGPVSVTYTSGSGEIRYAAVDKYMEKFILKGLDLQRVN